MSIQVIAAVYGTTHAGNDVTQICQNLVNNGNDDIPVNNDAMGGDPDFGVVKSFGILYSLNGGAPIALATGEGQTIDLVPSNR